MEQFIDILLFLTLFISDSSISTWIIDALGQNFFISPVALSSNLTPKANIRSASFIKRLVNGQPCIPSIPKYNSSSPENAPRPINVNATGILFFLAKS